jgi:hypothetical protein
MTHNMGTPDRIVRTFIVAPILIVLGVIAGASSVLGIVLFVLAAVMVGTSLVGFCPLYPLVGLNTCKKGGARTA